MCMLEVSFAMAVSAAWPQVSARVRNLKSNLKAKKNKQPILVDETK